MIALGKICEPGEEMCAKCFVLGGGMGWKFSMGRRLGNEGYGSSILFHSLP